MSINDITKLFIKECIYEAGQRALRSHVSTGELSSSRPVRRVCLHMNEDGSARLTIHCDMLNPYPKETNSQADGRAASDEWAQPETR